MRSSPAAIAIRLLQAVGAMFAVAVLWSTAGQRLDGWVGTTVDIVFWVYVVLRPVSVPLTWLTTTWVVDEAGVRYRHGWLARDETVVGWDEIVAVDISQPYLHRLFRCYTVRFGLGTSQLRAIRIDAVTPVVRDRIAALADRSPDTPRHVSHSAGPPASADRADRSVAGASTVPEADPIYRIRPADYLLISVTYGQFVLFVPAVLSLLDQVGEWVPLPLPDLAAVLRWPAPSLVAAGLVTVVASVVYGWLVAWLRYRGFRVTRTRVGYLATGGLLSSETRTVHARQVTGLKVTQNPLMRALGYGRVSVLTKDAGEQPMANLLFPVVRLTALPAALGADLPLPLELGREPLRLSRPARVGLVVTGLLLWTALTGLAYLIRPEWIVATVTLITVGVALVVNSRWVVAMRLPGQERCYARRGVFWVSQVDFDTRAVQVVESSQGLFGRLTRTWSVALHYYDGRVRCIRAIGCTPAGRAALTGTVLRRAEEVA